jgi:Skp family chaperone for outer membrane proteins
VAKDLTLDTNIRAEDKPSDLPLTTVLLANEGITLDANIRFVETFTVMGEGEAGQIARKEIEYKRDLATQEIQELNKKIEKAKTDYMNKASTMTDAAREKEEKRIIKMERDLKNLVAEKEEELKLDMQIATEKLALDMEAAVIEVAQEENIDIVIDKMTGRALYVAETFDYTDKIIDRVNKNHQIKLAQNQQTSTVKVAENTQGSPSKGVSV